MAEERQRIVAPAHLVGYAADEHVNAYLRNVGEIRWFLFWPDAEAAADPLMRACFAALEAWGVDAQCADGGLPVSGVYGVAAPVPGLQVRRGWRKHPS